MLDGEIGGSKRSVPSLRIRRMMKSVADENCGAYGGFAGVDETGALWASARRASAAAAVILWSADVGFLLAAVAWSLGPDPEDGPTGLPSAILGYLTDLIA